MHSRCAPAVFIVRVLTACPFLSQPAQQSKSEILYNHVEQLERFLHHQLSQVQHLSLSGSSIELLDTATVASGLSSLTYPSGHPVAVRAAWHRLVAFVLHAVVKLRGMFASATRPSDLMAVSKVVAEACLHICRHIG